jgi:hypothetical protein
MRRKGGAQALVACAVLLAGGIAGCRKDSDEDQVRAVIRKALTAANEKSAGGVVADAANGFKGPQNSDINECRRILVGYFMQQGWLHAFEKDLQITVDGANAKAKLECVLAKGRAVQKIEDVIPTDATVLEFDFDLAKLGDGWKFTRATYTHKL